MTTEEIKTLANEMMETFQRQGLTYADVDKLLICLTMRTREAEQLRVKQSGFKALPF
ncbi:hypothetical protein [Anaerotruncus colihominis]|uniref:hypothetical protein n=1 Tax=Anaerotruncus colihominis TaxID=169435 RepID=UPI0035141110